MRIAITSDLHINNWLAYSSLDRHGRPSRLTQYLQLADDFVSFAKENRADLVLLPGDLVESAVCRPQVLEVLREFLKRVSGEFPTLVVPGQHDLDVKVSNLSPHNSVLRTASDGIPDLVCFHEPAPFSFRGLSLFLQPWNPENRIHLEENQENQENQEDNGEENQNNGKGSFLPPVDVFVGHGIVSGSSNSLGFRFRVGFPQEALFRAARLSVMGDIHRGQVFRSPEKDRVVLVPGTPLQNSWRDHHECGFWLAEIDEQSREAPPSLTFSGIHELHPDRYHRFLYGTGEELLPGGDSPELTHFNLHPSLRNGKGKRKKNGEKTRADRIVTTLDEDALRSAGERIIGDAKPENSGLVRSLWATFLQEAPRHEGEGKSRCVVESLQIRDFLSVGEFRLDFSAFESQCVVVGDNGAGKTALPEALYWCLTGRTTRNLPLPQVIRRGAPRASVSVGLLVEGERYRVERWRERDGGPGLRLWVEQKKNGETNPENHGENHGENNDRGDSRSPDGGFVLYAGGSVKQTEKELARLIGLDHQELLLFSYFSTSRPVLYGQLGVSDRNDLLSRIGNLRVVDSLRERAKKEHGEFSERLLSTEGKVSEMEFSVAQLEQRIREVGEREGEKEREGRRERLSFLEERISSLEGVREERVRVGTRVSDLAARRAELSPRIGKLEDELSSLKRKKDSVETDGECPTCGVFLRETPQGTSLLADLTRELREKEEALLPLSTEFRRVVEEAEKRGRELSSLEERDRSLSVLEREREELLARERKDEASRDSRSSLLREQLEAQGSRLREEREKLLSLRRETSARKWLFSVLFRRGGELATELNRHGASLLQRFVDELTGDLDFRVTVNRDPELVPLLHRGAVFPGTNGSGKTKGSTKQSNGALPYPSLSSGQQRLVDLVMMIAMNNLFSYKFGLPRGVLGLCVFDEVLSHLDESGVDRCRLLLDRLRSAKTLVISHDSRVNALFNDRIQASLENDGGEPVSSYRSSWGS